MRVGTAGEVPSGPQLLRGPQASVCVHLLFQHVACLERVFSEGLSKYE